MGIIFAIGCKSPFQERLLLARQSQLTPSRFYTIEFTSPPTHLSPVWRTKAAKLRAVSVVPGWAVVRNREVKQGSGALLLAFSKAVSLLPCESSGRKTSGEQLL